MIVTMVCLTLCLLLLGAMLRLAMIHSRQMRIEQYRLQAEWLAVSGLERAVWRLGRDSGYSGESWELTLEELGGRDTGRVDIGVTTSDSHENQAIITVIASFPATSPLPVRCRQTLAVDRPDSP